MVRFEDDDDLIELIDKIAKKLAITKSGMAKCALYDYCIKIQEMSNGDQ